MPRTLKQVAVDMANAFTRWQLWQGGGSSTLSDLTDVELTDLQTDDVLKYDGNKWINAIMQGGGSVGAQIDTLWTNPNPLSSFNSQNVNINTAYDIFIIDFRPNNTSTVHATMFVNKVINRAYRLYCNSGASQDQQYQRSFTIQNTYINFGQGTRPGIAFDDSLCIPTVIYGIKFAAIEAVEEIPEPKMQDVYHFGEVGGNVVLLKETDEGTNILTSLFNRIATSFEAFYEYCTNNFRQVKQNVNKNATDIATLNSTIHNTNFINDTLTPTQYCRYNGGGYCQIGNIVFVNVYINADLINGSREMLKGFPKPKNYQIYGKTNYSNIDGNISTNGSLSLRGTGDAPDAGIVFNCSYIIE